MAYQPWCMKGEFEKNAVAASADDHPVMYILYYRA